jgi:hypothetical protein
VSAQSELHSQQTVQRIRSVAVDGRMTGHASYSSRALEPAAACRESRRAGGGGVWVRMAGRVTVSDATRGHLAQAISFSGRQSASLSTVAAPGTCSPWPDAGSPSWTCEGCAHTTPATSATQHDCWCHDTKCYTLRWFLSKWLMYTRIFQQLPQLAPLDSVSATTCPLSGSPQCHHRHSPYSTNS